MATTYEEIRSIEPGSLLFFGYKGEYCVVVLKHKVRVPGSIAVFEVLWPDGGAQDIFFWPQEDSKTIVIATARHDTPPILSLTGHYVTIIHPNPNPEV